MVHSLELVLLTIVSSSKGRHPPPGSSTGVLNLRPPWLVDQEYTFGKVVMSFLLNTSKLNIWSMMLLWLSDLTSHLNLDSVTNKVGRAQKACLSMGMIYSRIYPDWLQWHLSFTWKSVSYSLGKLYPYLLHRKLNHLPVGTLILTDFKMPGHGSSMLTLFQVINQLTPDIRTLEINLFHVFSILDHW